ncbi:MAG: cytochrome b [Saccharospirillaceae bacterium]|nr:cytochrome b [Pseudomonadales bacterium]NRB81935.1 cytochrome b [Saccharospirillaceae bacterium]
MIKNTTLRYGLVAMIFHWLSALIIIFMFGLGIYMMDLPYGHPYEQTSFNLHQSIGMSFFILWTLRIIWRLINVSPKLDEAITTFKKFEKLSVHVVHTVLYLLMFVMLFSGYLLAITDGSGYSFTFWGWFEVPSFGEFFEQRADLAGLIHEFVSWVLIGLASIHALAALKHHFIDKDDTLKKMLPKKHNQEK